MHLAVGRLAVGSQSFRADIIDGLREMAMAKSAAKPMEMVHFVQRQLGVPEELTIPVLAYFSQAFSLPLVDVLPLREWLQGPDDAPIPEALDRRLYEWKFMKVQAFEDRNLNRMAYEEIITKTKVLSKYYATFHAIEEPTDGQVKLTGCVVFQDRDQFFPSNQRDIDREAELDREWKVVLSKLDEWGFVPKR